jgi:hypothetical protein
MTNTAAPATLSTITNTLVSYDLDPTLAPLVLASITEARMRREMGLPRIDVRAWIREPTWAQELERAGMPVGR